MYRRKPSYRRRYVRKTPYKRTYGKKIARLRKPMRRAVVHQINRKAETKMDYTNYPDYPIDPANLTRCDIMGNIIKGSDSDARIGDVVNLANVKIKYEIQVREGTQYEGTHTVSEPQFIITAEGRRQPYVGR